MAFGSSLGPTVNHWRFQEHSFLAAMSRSRSDNVTKFVSCSHFFSLEHSKHLKQDVLRELQGCLFEVLWAFQGSLKGVSRKF